MKKIGIFIDGKSRVVRPSDGREPVVLGAYRYKMEIVRKKQREYPRQYLCSRRGCAGVAEEEKQRSPGTYRPTSDCSNSRRVITSSRHAGDPLERIFASRSRIVHTRSPPARISSSLFICSPKICESVSFSVHDEIRTIVSHQGFARQHSRDSPARRTSGR